MKFLVLSIFFPILAWSQNPIVADIIQVFDNSQDQRLTALKEKYPSSELSESQLISEIFTELIKVVLPSRSIELVFVSGSGITAESFSGKIVAVDNYQMLANFDSNEQRFILAHEIGHIVLDHGKKLSALYKKHIPGEVKQEITDRVSGILGKEASDLNKKNEHEADFFAVKTLILLGYDIEKAISIAETHPGTFNRIRGIREEFKN